VSEERPFVFGILGGIGSGKSTVAELLVQRGALLLDADAAGHEALRLPHVKEALRTYFGDLIFDEVGEVVRGKLAERVFSVSPGKNGKNNENRRFLEGVVHPEIRNILESKRANSQSRVFVLDAPLLVEAKWCTICDCLLFVEAPLEMRLSRVVQRGWDAGMLAAREAAQFPLEEKRKMSDVVVNNNTDDMIALNAELEKVWHKYIV